MAPGHCVELESNPRTYAQVLLPTVESGCGEGNVRIAVVKFIHANHAHPQHPEATTPGAWLGTRSQPRSQGAI